MLSIMCNVGESDILFWDELQSALTTESSIDSESLFASVDMQRYFTYDGSFPTPGNSSLCTMCFLSR